MQLLAFRRQFLLTPSPVAEFRSWQQASAGPYALHVHPDCPLSIAACNGQTAILIGYVLDPRQPGATDADLAGRMARCDTLEGFDHCLHGLSGRFLAMQIRSGMMRIFADACGLRSLFWTVSGGRFHAASQPALLGCAVPLEPSEARDQYLKSEYIRIKPGHYHPAGVSLFEDVHQMVPNHYLEVRFPERGAGDKKPARRAPQGAIPADDATQGESLGESHVATNDDKHDDTLDGISSGGIKIVTFQPDRVRHRRYYPTRPLREHSFEEGLAIFTELLRGSLDAASRRYPLALALSAGVDSRTMLAAAGHFLENGLAYSLIYRDLTEESPDIRLPVKLASLLDFKHLVIDARVEPPQKFLKLYNANVDIPHTRHWGPPAAAMIANLPGNWLTVKGDGAEIVRRYYYRYTRHPRIDSHRHFVKMVKGWEGIPFIDKALSQWYDGVRPAAEKTGYQLLDLFYWEHEMGGWMARNQLEWDIAQEVFTPFGNRELLEAALEVDDRWRRLPENRFFMQAIERMWPDALSVPVHPVKDTPRRIRKTIKKLLMRAGLVKPKKGGR
jgi:hypothetical protein